MDFTKFKRSLLMHEGRTITTVCGMYYLKLTNPVIAELCLQFSLNLPMKVEIIVDRPNYAPASYPSTVSKVRIVESDWAGFYWTLLAFQITPIRYEVVVKKSRE